METSLDEMVSIPIFDVSLFVNLPRKSICLFQIFFVSLINTINKILPRPGEFIAQSIIISYKDDTAVIK